MTFRKLPMGIQDVLPDECQALNEIKARLQKKFALSGFRPVLSAAVEYYDTYSQISNAIAQERMFKLSDTDGKLLVLRPDVTLSIARIAATKLEEKTARLSYVANKWDLQNAGGITSREIYQAGVECFGEEGAFSDARTIAFAIECLKEVGLDGFIIDVGHVGYFKGILEECGLSEEESETVRALINAKDGLNAERILRKAGANKDTLNTVLALPTLFGGGEVLDRAEALTKNAVARSAIAHLKQVYSILKQLGYEEYVCFDMGTVKRLSYYTGIVFSAIVKELGAPVLSGGRYDGLADDFGKHIPAVGFAIGLKRLLVALERQENLPEEHGVDIAVGAQEGAEAAAYAFYREMTAQGKVVVLCSDYGKDAVMQQAAKERYYAAEGGVEKI